MTKYREHRDEYFRILGQYTGWPTLSQKDSQSLSTPIPLSWITQGKPFTSEPSPKSAGS